ncbi:MAG: sugar ABC transporter substrate-binding protein [Spirochaetes bacterium]|nr:sugar ABC transporter substrate-binding protein [Spirochaetota bacterium]
MKSRSILVIFLVFCLFSCGLVKESKEGVYFLIRGNAAEIKLWEKAVSLFEKENPDIKVRMEHVPYGQYWPKIETMIAGGSSPDVIFLESTRASAFIDLNALEPLNSYIEDDSDFKKENYYPQAIQAYTHEGILYGIPNDMAIYAVYYNQDLFDRAGVDYPRSNWTWTDFRKICQALTIDQDKDGNPETYGFNIGWTYYLWIWQNGGDFYNNASDPKQSTINTKAVKDALQFLKDLIYKYRVAPTFAQAASFGDAAEMFMTGKVAMIIEGHWMVPQFKSIKSFKWDVASTAAAELPKRKVKANYNAGSCFSIPRMAKHKEKAWKLIKFLAGNKGQKILIEGGFSTPALQTKEITDFFLKSTPPQNNKIFLDMIKYAHLPPVMPRYNEMNDTMYRELDYFWLNKKPIDEVLQGLKKQLDQLLEKR